MATIILSVIRIHLVVVIVFMILVNIAWYFYQKKLYKDIGHYLSIKELPSWAKRAFKFFHYENEVIEGFFPYYNFGIRKYNPLLKEDIILLVTNFRLIIAGNKGSIELINYGNINDIKNLDAYNNHKVPEFLRETSSIVVDKKDDANLIEIYRVNRIKDQPISYEVLSLIYKIASKIYSLQSTNLAPKSDTNL